MGSVEIKLKIHSPGKKHVRPTGRAGDGHALAPAASSGDILVPLLNKEQEALAAEMAISAERVSQTTSLGRRVCLLLPQRACRLS